MNPNDPTAPYPTNAYGHTDIVRDPSRNSTWPVPSSAPRGASGTAQDVTIPETRLPSEPDGSSSSQYLVQPRTEDRDHQASERLRRLSMTSSADSEATMAGSFCDTEYDGRDPRQSQVNEDKRKRQKYNQSFKPQPNARPQKMKQHQNQIDQIDQVLYPPGPVYAQVPAGYAQSYPVRSGGVSAQVPGAAMFSPGSLPNGNRTGYNQMEWAETEVAQYDDYGWPLDRSHADGSSNHWRQ